MACPATCQGGKGDGPRTSARKVEDTMVAGQMVSTFGINGTDALRCWWVYCLWGYGVVCNNDNENMNKQYCCKNLSIMVNASNPLTLTA